MSMRRALALLGVLLASCPLLVLAHDARPIYVQVHELEPGRLSVQTNVPAALPAGGLPRVEVPKVCRPLAEAVRRHSPGGTITRQAFACDGALSGARLGIVFPGVNPSLTTLFQVRLSNGEQHFRVLKPGDYDWQVPVAEDRLGVAAEYLGLGVEHIWVGVDHLLFVACLLFIAQTAKRLLITITGFTVAHSLTLALAALDWVRVPVAPVEAVIALSVVFLAWEILRGDRSSWTFRYPVAVSGSFGLLHGFGFAAVLHDIGLPQTELPTALLFFNLGVEVGQLLFVAALLGGYAALRWLASRVAGQPLVATRLPGLVTTASYVIGGIASYWMIERLAGFWA